MGQSSNKYDVIIAGAGPAGSSAAIHLASQGLRILLIEQKEFPRPKLCGEFISPECLRHFQKLGVAEAMSSSNPSTITRTVFYSSRGHRVAVPSSWFGGGAALGLSRSAMDNNLFEKTQSLGVDVLQNTTVTDVLQQNGHVCGVRVKTPKDDNEYFATLTLDATGRSRILTRRIDDGNKDHVQRGLVAFKAHLTGADQPKDVCEIYSYPRGYGGLSTVENGNSNLCFIVSARDVRRYHSDADTVMHETVMRNQRAAVTLRHAQRSSDWLSVSLDRFGPANPAPKNGLLAIGDSASFIDPFTGSGMLMALESGELVAKVIDRHLEALSDPGRLDDLRCDYFNEYRSKFGSRLRISGWLRRTAFSPRLAELTIIACSLSDSLRNRLARATRPTVNDDQPTVSIS